MLLVGAREFSVHMFKTTLLMANVISISSVEALSVQIYHYIKVTVAEERAALTSNSIDMCMAFSNNITGNFVMGVLLTSLMSLLHSLRTNTRNQDHASLDSEQGTKHTCSKGVNCKNKWMKK